MCKLSGAEIIMESFHANGIKTIFLFPGGTIAPILDLAVKANIRLFCARHEQGAGYAGLAAARLSGRPQVVMVTSGPGVTNVVTPIADAYFDSTPLIVVCGQVGTKDLKRDMAVRQRGFQETDTVALMRPIAKSAILVERTEDLPAIMALAFRLAAEGRPGPVVLDMPMDVQRGLAEIVPATPEPPRTVPEPRAHDITQLAGWIRESKRPLLLAGQGVLQSGAVRNLRELSKRFKIPIVTSLLGVGATKPGDALSVGMVGHTGSQLANLAVHSADLMIAVGSRLDVRQTGSKTDQFVPHGRVVRVDLDQGEIKHGRVRCDLAIFADARATLFALLNTLTPNDAPASKNWLAQITAWRKRHDVSYDRGSKKLKPQMVIEWAEELTSGKELVAVTGVGLHQQWVARHFGVDFPKRTLLTSGGHGAMGYDLPSAIGAQIAFPGKLVLCFVGDGSLQINIQELAAVAEHKLPIKIIVLDNHRLGIVSQFQNLNWADDPTCGNKYNPDFAAIARAYDLPACTITSPKQRAAFAKALRTPGPVLIHCKIDPKEDIVPMLLAGQTMDKMWPEHKT